MRYTASSCLLLLLSVCTGPAWCGGPQSIDPIALNEWLDGRDPPLMLDVRSRTEYLAGTVPGALDAGSNPDGFLPDSQGGVAVLVTTEETLLKAWHARLSAFGYRVHVLEGGLPAWQDAGLPVEQPEAGYVRPGTVPFVIPRGICEMNEPAEVFK